MGKSKKKQVEKAIRETRWKASRKKLYDEWFKENPHSTRYGEPAVIMTENAIAKPKTEEEKYMSDYEKIVTEIRSIVKESIDGITPEPIKDELFNDKAYQQLLEALNSVTTITIKE